MLRLNERMSLNFLGKSFLQKYISQWPRSAVTFLLFSETKLANQKSAFLQTGKRGGK